MTTKEIAQMSRHEILDQLLEDGYELETSADAAEVSLAIQRAARAGSLVWTTTHIVATGPARIETVGRVVRLARS